MRKYIAVFLIILLAPLSAGFTKRYNKATGKEELIMISTEKERQIGAKIAKQVEKDFKETSDPLLQSRFEKIGSRLAACTEREDVLYHFKVLESKEEEQGYNAFALPGGYVYMFDTLMKTLGTDDKIAAVTAHELAHVAARHAIKRLQSNMGINALLLLAIGTGQNPADVADAAGALSQLMLAYSRQDEFEADVLSVRYLREAGFDPEGVVQSLQTLQELRKKGPLRKYPIYRSHPYLSERLARARTEISGKMDFTSYINLPEKNREEF